MEVVVPTITGTFQYEGRRVRWIRGRTKIASGHPILKGREHLVMPLELDFPLPEPKTSAKAKTS